MTCQSRFLWTILLLGGPVAALGGCQIDGTSELEGPSHQVSQAVTVAELTGSPGPIVTLGPDQLTTATVRPRGRFRALLLGFRVDEETWDHVLEVDGKRDEVFVDYVVQEADRNLSPIGPLLHRRTEVIGDTWQNEHRHQGGSASDRGGLMSGDEYPAAGAHASYIRNRRDALPLEIWSGELVAGGNGVVIMPSIWEWDDHTSRIAQDWVATVHRAAPEIVRFAGSVAQGQRQAGIIAGITTLIPAVERLIGDGVGDAQTRPVGMVPDASGRFNFEPQGLALNYEQADRLTRTEFVAGQPGVLAFNFKDHSHLRGQYTLYLLLQRASDQTPP